MKKVLLLLVTLAVMLTSTTGCSLFKKNLDNVIDVNNVTNNSQTTEVTTVDNTTEDIAKEVNVEKETVSIPTNTATNNVVYTETPTSNVTSNATVTPVTNDEDKKPVVDDKPTPTVPSKPKDTVAPTIDADDIVTEFRMEPIFDSISALDETDGPVQVSILGKYDITKAGIYPMSAVAIDRAGNSTTKYFNVIVKEHPKQSDLNNAEKDVLAKKELLDEAKKQLEQARNEFISKSNTLAINEENLTNLNLTLDDLNTRKSNAQDSLHNTSMTNKQMKLKKALIHLEIY